jgi:hypothetical protein
MPKIYTANEQLPASEYNEVVKTAGLFASSSAGSDAYAITVTPACGSYAVGDIFRFKADVANTGACTLNVSGLGAISIKKDLDKDPDTNDIQAGQIITVAYDGTNFQILGGVGTGGTKTYIAGESITAGQPLVADAYVSEAVTYGNRSHHLGNEGTNGAKVLTISHTIGSNSNRLLVVNLCLRTGTTIQGLTYNGVSMTQHSISASQSGGGLNHYLYTYILFAPDTGTHDVVLNYTIFNATTDYHYMSVKDYYNVAQSISNSNTGISSGSASSLTITVSGVTQIGGMLVSHYLGISSGSYEYSQSSSTNMKNNWYNFSQGVYGTTALAIGHGDSGQAVNVANISSTGGITGGSIPLLGSVLYLKPTTTATYRAKKMTTVSVTNPANHNLYSHFIGFAKYSATLGNPVVVQEVGKVDGLSSLSPFTVYYGQNTAGTIGTSVGTNTKKLGYSVSDTELYIQPDTN